MHQVPITPTTQSGFKACYRLVHVRPALPELNHRPLDLMPNILTTHPHAPQNQSIILARSTIEEAADKHSMGEAHTGPLSNNTWDAARPGDNRILIILLWEVCVCV